MIREIEIRELTTRDIPAARQLSSLSGWNQTAADWQTLMQLDPQGCLALDCDGRLAATTTLTGYGSRLAWIGMVLTHPEYRRRGFARRLVERALELAETRGIATLKLDATEEGRALYESLGFEEEQEIQRWSGTSTMLRQSGGVTRALISAGLDSEAFGADRSQLLHLLSRRVVPRATEEGHALWRPGARAGFLGPFVARTPAVAHTLVQAVFGGNGQRWFWDLLPSNREAVALASDFGFQVERRLMRMVRGESLRGNDTLIYGAAGFEFG